MESLFPRPARDESAPYFDTYIRLVPDGDIVLLLENQFRATLPFLQTISEEASGYRYAEGKWSVRELLNHITDTERVMLFRAHWFARDLGSSLPGMDQDVAAAAAGAHNIAWAAHIAELRSVREATLSFFRNLPEAKWSSRGAADGKPFTVRALAHVIHGHLAYHEAILRERYLSAKSDRI